jgi:DNA processing protein
MDIYWLWLSSIKGIGPINSKLLLQRFSTPQLIYSAERDELEGVEGIGKHIIEIVSGSKSLAKAEKIMKDCNRNGISILTFDDKLYPDKVMMLRKSPVVLYYKGTLINESIGIGITGSRNCSEYGKKVAVEAAEFLASKNITLISGMAKGIDCYAHTACLNKGGYTIAVLGNGIDVCYPKENKKLMDKIIERGAVVSPFPPDTSPSKFNFPKRNYLLSGWSEKILIAEAGQKCGSMLTAALAMEHGREVLAVPNSIYCSGSSGTNSLIESGCKIYLSPHQLVPYGHNIVVNDPQTVSSPVKTRHKTGLEEKIIAIVKETPRTIDEIISSLKEDREEVFDVITNLELEGKLKTVSGCRLAEIS